MRAPVLMVLTGDPMNFTESATHLVELLVANGNAENKHTCDVTFRIVDGEATKELTYRIQLLKWNKTIDPKGSSRPTGCP